MPVSREDVIAAYRFILGREPENEEVILKHQNAYPHRTALRSAFLSCSEFQTSYNPNMPSPRVSIYARPLEVETEVDPETLRRIIRKTASYWEGIGETAPHWSVLTFAEYLPEQLPANEDAFFESGRGDLGILLACLQRIGSSVERFRRCGEFGCGVGRLTIHLAETFPNVVALDISRPHLRQTAAALERRGINNVSLAQVTAEDVHPASDYDLWFCRIVLLHNPPPVVLHILDKMFGGLAPHGVAVFQLPTYLEGYSFNAARYLAGNLGETMELHATPLKAIQELAWRHHCCLLDIREPDAAAGEVNPILVFQKIGAPSRSG